MTDSQTFRTTVHTSLMRYILWKGTAIAILGALLLIGGGIFIPEHQLSFWGLPLFLAGFGLITWGMLPYRQLKKLETTPNAITIDSDWIVLRVAGKEILSIPLAAIESVHYIEDNKGYGIGVNLKKPQTLKVLAHHPKMAMGTYRHHGCDLFLPFFSERTTEMLREYL